MPPTAGLGRRHLLLVAGAGRSGTSLVTGLIGRLGVHIPLPEVTADQSNPKGFGEPRWAVDFHNELLKDVNVATEDGRPEAWDSTAPVAEDAAARARLRAWLEEQYAVADRVVIKDPRLAWFLELYIRVAGEMGVAVSVLTMLRDPAESVKSRELAYGTKSSPTTRMASWLNMMIGTELRTRSLPRAFVPYDALMADWRAELTAAEKALDLPLLRDSTSAQQADAAALVDVSLRRAQADWAQLGLAAPLEDLTRRTYAALQGLAGVEDAGCRDTLDGLREEYAAMYEAAADLTRSRVRAARVEERRKRARPDPAPAEGTRRPRLSLRRGRRG